MLGALARNGWFLALTWLGCARGAAVDPWAEGGALPDTDAASETSDRGDQPAGGEPDTSAADAHTEQAPQDASADAMNAPRDVSASGRPDATSREDAATAGDAATANDAATVRDAATVHDAAPPKDAATVDAQPDASSLPSQCVPSECPPCLTSGTQCCGAGQCGCQYGNPAPCLSNTTHTPL